MISFTIFYFSQSQNVQAYSFHQNLVYLEEKPVTAHTLNQLSYWNINLVVMKVIYMI